MLTVYLIGAGLGIASGLFCAGYYDDWEPFFVLASAALLWPVVIALAPWFFVGRWVAKRREA